MRFILVFLIIFLFQCSITSSQVIFEVKHINTIVIGNYGNIYFYEKKGNKYREVVIDFNNKSEESSYKPEITKRDWKDNLNIFDSTAQIIAVRDIKPYTAKGLLRHFKHYQYNTKEVNGKYTTIGNFHLFNRHFMLITSKNFYKDIENHEGYDYDLSGFCLLKLGMNKHIVVFHSNVNLPEFFIPHKNRSRLFMSNPNGFRINEQSINFQKVDQSWKTNDSIMNNLFSDDHYTEEYDIKKDELFVLLGPFENKVLRKRYDKIELEENFIVATRNNKTTIYNMLLNQIASNVKVYNFNTDKPKKLTILKNDSIYSIDYKGNLIPQQYDEPNHSNNYSNTEDNSKLIKIENSKKEWYAELDIEIRYHKNASQKMISKSLSYRQKNILQFPKGIIPEKVELIYNRYRNNYIYVWQDEKMGLFSLNFGNAYADLNVIDS